MPQLEIDGTGQPKNEPDEAPSQKATLGLKGDNPESSGITGAIVADPKEEANKKKTEQDQIDAAITAKQAAAKPVQVTKPKDPPQGTKGGKTTAKAADPKQPKQYNPSTISSELWIFNFGVAFSMWSYMRHVHAVKKEGQVDNQGLQHQLAKAWNAGPVWYAIGAGVAAVKYAMGGKMTKPLTEEHLKEFTASHPEYDSKIQERQLKDTVNDPQSPSVNTSQKNSTLSSLGNKFQEKAKTLSDLASSFTSNLGGQKTSQKDQQDKQPVVFSDLSKDHNKPVKPSTSEPLVPTTPTNSQTAARRPSLR